FLMEYERLDFREAVAMLANQVGVQIPDDGEAAGPGAATLQPVYDILADAARRYQRQLRQAPQAIAYLRGRGIDGAIAKTFGIGYAPPGWNFLGGQIETRAAVSAGLLVAGEAGNAYDRFRNRIMFPIRDGRGRVIGFGGRALDEDPAKYLNSPETPLFHKGRNLYGFYEMRQALKQLPRVFLVEGYMDVIALAQHGLANANATLGTATTTDHLQQLFRNTDEVVFCFDGDAAGRRAAWRALDNALALMRGTRRVRFLFLPEGEDPDTLVRGADGTERFRALADASRPASAVLLEGLARDVDMDSADGRSRLVEKARPYIQKLPPEALKAELLQELAARCGLPPQDLERLYRGSGNSRAAAGPAAPAPGVKRTAVRRALQLLMHQPALADTVADGAQLRSAPVAGAEILAEAIEFLRDHPNRPLSVLLERWRERPESKALQQLAAETPRGEKDDLAREFRECVERIRIAVHDDERARFHALLSQQQQQPLSASEATELQHLLQRLRKTAR
ncbi:MAG: DNA primase, partial [Salinisphaera sp.]|nr:DNA primase [Salinisphaera sp.]